MTKRKVRAAKRLKTVEEYQERFPWFFEGYRDDYTCYRGYLIVKRKDGRGWAVFVADRRVYTVLHSCCNRYTLKSTEAKIDWLIKRDAAKRKPHWRAKSEKAA